MLNVDKPPLNADDIKQRVAQFAGKAPVALTRAETFRKKAGLFPNCPFVVGADTAERLVAERYYGNSQSGMLTALAEIWAAGCRFLVAGPVGGRPVQDPGRGAHPRRILANLRPNPRVPVPRGHFIHGHTLRNPETCIGIPVELQAVDAFQKIAGNFAGSRPANRSKTIQ